MGQTDLALYVLIGIVLGLFVGSLTNAVTDGFGPAFLYCGLYAAQVTGARLARSVRKRGLPYLCATIRVNPRPASQTRSHLLLAGIHSWVAHT